ncbi:shikimate dehydrogenase [Microvirga terrestris]|uniref:Shikimate dehydrogenase (NADP(+)) n=1 Tax=Microvirga terrestris TaxID=2791024 RepID=A0ABS0HXR3_9HYPH|nr:shikimate dehydrogenase [Microvirga terrestris]MBF9198250.1 shikimate dehydrogenase [Microvirga terrestris]
MAKAFVVGHPIKHSRSPLIHGHWLKAYGLDGSYERIDVAPVNFGDFLASFHERGFAGGNVTLPYKEAAYLGVARRTERAQRVGAVNTLWVEDGVIWGDNTDALGFIGNLDASLGTGWEQDVETALVLGAGGAARAVVAGLQDRPLKRIFVANRTLAKAEDIARDLRPGSAVSIETSPWEALGRVIPHAQLIVNTTSLGMTGQPPLTIDLSRAPRNAVVADIVYVPLETPLLAAAAAHNLRTVDGLGMLLHQAVPGFRRWFGVTPEVTPALRAVILADLEASR